MSATNPISNVKSDGADPRWRDLYKIGGIACYAGVAVVVLAIVAFFIWPYQPGAVSTAEIFSNLQTDRLGGLIALDLPFLAGTFVSIFVLPALYVALKRVNESYALIALVLGIIAVLSLIPARPIAEMVYLSDRYAAATNEAARNQFLAAGEALLAYFNGTAWLVNIVFSSISSLISSLLMLRSRNFGKGTAWIGIVSNSAALAFFLPAIGILLLFLATIGGTVFLALVGRSFFRMERSL
jgi:hypothetical protein